MNKENSISDAEQFFPKSREKIQLLMDGIDVMADYASVSGKSISEELAKSLADINIFKDRVYRKEKIDVEEISSLYSTAIFIHNQLTKIVSPATPESIKATERIGKSFRIKNAATNLLVYITLSCLALFVITAVPFDIKEDFRTLIRSLNLLFAAGLGAGFYSLFSSQRYIRQRTYNPSYNQMYYVRFVLGLAAGTILGHFGPTIIPGSLAHQLGPSILAIIGGYSADAVAQILQRIAETLVTVVRGSNQQELESREREIRAEVNETVIREKNVVAKKLQGITSIAGDEQSPKTRKEIDKLISELLR